MARPKRRATKFIPNRTTLHHPPVVAPISVVDHCLPYEKHNLYDVTFNNTILRDHHHRVLTVGLDVLLFFYFFEPFFFIFFLNC